MHDIDRVRLEIQPEGETFEAEQFEFGETEFAGNEVGEVFSEMETMELASELLGVSSEAEMEQFLGSLIGKWGDRYTMIVENIGLIVIFLLYAVLNPLFWWAILLSAKCWRPTT